jgi:hypothetical protein
LKPRIDPNKWYCEYSIPCIQKAKAKWKICPCAVGHKQKQVFLGCKEYYTINGLPCQTGYKDHKYTKFIQGFWLLMKINCQDKNNT